MPSSTERFTGSEQLVVTGGDDSALRWTSIGGEIQRRVVDRGWQNMAAPWAPG